MYVTLRKHRHAMTVYIEFATRESVVQVAIATILKNKISHLFFSTMSTKRELLKLDKKELIKLCKKHKVKSHGKKNDMIDRLLTSKSFNTKSPTSKHKRRKSTKIKLPTSASNWSKKPIDARGVIPVVIGSCIFYNGIDGIGKYDPKSNKICKSWKYEDLSNYDHCSCDTALPSCSTNFDPSKLYIFNGNTGELITFNTTSEKVENVTETTEIGPYSTCAVINDHEFVIIGDGSQATDGCIRIMYNAKSGKIRTYKSVIAME